VSADPYADMAEFYAWDGDTLVLNVLGRPRAKQDRIGTVIGRQLEVYVAAVPRAGRATAHMLRFLSGVFGVPESAIEVVLGVMNVNKQLRIHAPARLPEMISGSAFGRA